MTLGRPRAQARGRPARLSGMMDDELAPGCPAPGRGPHGRQLSDAVRAGDGRGLARRPAEGGRPAAGGRSPPGGLRVSAHGVRVAVVGGGIGGLTAAAFLNRAEIEVTVFEQARALTEVGAGLVVTPNAVRLLRRLGQFDRFRRRAVSLEVGWELRRWANGRVL